MYVLNIFFFIIVIIYMYEIRPYSSIYSLDYIVLNGQAEAIDRSVTHG